MLIKEFFDTQYLTYALYDTYRSIGNYLDGNKPSMRKILHTLERKNITTNTKVSILQSTVSAETMYIHGENNLGLVIINMAKNYPGTNNLNLLEPEGNFGSRFINDASATRYIFTKKSKWFDLVYNKLDSKIIPEQSFEGEKIEPIYMMPIIPMLLINGCEGIGNGYAQKIYSRNPKEVVDYILNKLDNKNKKFELLPYYAGFTGTIAEDPNIENNKYFMKGILNVINSTTIDITEIPISYDLNSYLKILDTLVSNKVIKDYDDFSDNDVFKFTISCTREFTANNNESKLYDIFKLIKPLNENYTCIDENNKIIEFNSVHEILDKFIEKRLEYYQLRKKYLLADLNNKLTVKSNKAKFVKSIIDGSLNIYKVSKQNIIDQLHQNNLSMVDDSYNYLLNMPIYSFTKELIKELVEDIKTLQGEIKDLNEKSNTDLWRIELAMIKDKL